MGYRADNIRVQVQVQVLPYPAHTDEHECEYEENDHTYSDSADLKLAIDAYGQYRDDMGDKVYDAVSDEKLESLVSEALSLPEKYIQIQGFKVTDYDLERTGPGYDC